MAMQIAGESEFVFFIRRVAALIFIIFANVMQPGKDEFSLIIQSHLLMSYEKF